MIKFYILERLTEESVNVKTQNLTVIDGVEYPVGNPHRVGYKNNAEDRLLIENELPEPQKNAIFAVWGNEPTVDDSVTT